MSNLSFCIIKNIGVIKTDMRCVESFLIYWLGNVSNIDLYKMNGSQTVVLEMKRRCFLCLERVMRMLHVHISKVALAGLEQATKIR